MFRRMLVPLALLVTCLATTGVTAQTAPDESLTWRAFVAGLETGATVEVQLKDGTRARGTVVPGKEDALHIKPHTRVPEPVRVFPYSSVASIERWREGMMPGTKTLLGIGAGVGVALVTVAVALAGGY